MIVARSAMLHSVQVKIALLANSGWVVRGGERSPTCGMCLRVINAGARAVTDFFLCQSPRLSLGGGSTSFHHSLQDCCSGT